MAGGTWKIAVLVVVMTLLTLLELRTVEAQTASGCGQCSTNAYCYNSYGSSGAYYCVCRRGYYGDGYAGSGYAGCQRRRLRAWQVVVSVIGTLLGALLLLALCLACLRSCLSRRRRGDPMVRQPGEPAYGYPQQTFPPQGVPLYETNTHKVPGPAGVV